MKINRVILKGVNNFTDFSHSFEDAWTQTVPDSILLMGPNGCGKTTLLRSIANLWTLLGRFLEQQQKIISIQRFSIFYDLQLAAIEIKDFLPDISEPIWIYQGVDGRVSQFLKANKNSYRIGWTQIDTGDSTEYSISYMPPNNLKTEMTSQPQQWVDELRELFTKNRLGAQFDLSNMVFLESETRTFYGIDDEEFSITPEKEIFTWLARYRASLRREGSIQNYLFTLKAINETKYEQIVTAINEFLVDKKIIGFDPTTTDLLIKTKSGQTHPIHLLSSGEKQILLMLTFIRREFRPSGIVLIDEPDLHLHVSLQNAFISHLKQMVAEQNGQLIVASHSPELWSRFTEAQSVKLEAKTGVQA